MWGEHMAAKRKKAADRGKPEGGGVYLDGKEVAATMCQLQTAERQKQQAEAEQNRLNDIHARICDELMKRGDANQIKTLAEALQIITGIRRGVI